MRISNRGLDLVKAHEGLRLNAYDDFRPNYALKPGDTVKGTLTIGYGSTGPHVRIGMTVTEAEAAELLKADLAWAEGAVNEYARGPMLQNEFDALVSLTFNIGATALKNSTLLRCFNAGDKLAAADQFLRWTRSKGIELPGLKSRRVAERNMFMGV